LNALSPVCTRISTPAYYHCPILPYSQSLREIFLRELVSNANDAIEKLRIISLTDKDVWSGGDPLNITIKAEKSVDGKTGKLVISDTGIGMSEQELAANLVCKPTHGFWSSSSNDRFLGYPRKIRHFGISCQS
jgi:HSP90 family molecular chaperone